MAYCGSCGKQITENAYFCGSCGAKVGAQIIGNISSTPAPAAPPPAVQPPLAGTHQAQTKTGHQRLMLSVLIRIIGFFLCSFLLYKSIVVFSTPSDISNAERMVVSEMQSKYGIFKDQYEIHKLFNNSRGTVMMAKITAAKYQDPEYRKYFIFILAKDQNDSSYYSSNYDIIISTNPPNQDDVESITAHFK
jgi:hypothetical protein